jgi:heme-degrading monooxygenase HmoA
MVIRITWGRLLAGTWSEFERTYRAKVSEHKTVKGLRGRLLVQDSADKDAGFTMSLWENLADMETYEQSPLYREVAAAFEPFFAGEYKTHRGEVKYVDMANPLGRELEAVNWSASTRRRRRP